MHDSSFGHALSVGITPGILPAGCIADTTAVAPAVTFLRPVNDPLDLLAHH